MKILLTGVTGQVGSFLGPKLRQRGHQVVCLVRGCDPATRVRSLLGDAADAFEYVTGDITDTAGGFQAEDFARYRGRIDCLVHPAGSVKFDWEMRDEIMATNVGGTRNMLYVARHCGISRICYVSSVYALGEPRNPYEESKAEAERLVKNWSGGEFQILRPSVVLGHSQTGVTTNYTGYYGFLSGFSYLKHRLHRLWQESGVAGQDNWRQQGFEFDAAGRLVFLQPLYVPYNPDSTLNLVPVDWLVAAMAEIIERGAQNRSYNLVDSNPQTDEFLTRQSMEILGIAGWRPKWPLDFDPGYDANSLLGQIQAKIDQRLSRFAPYISQEDRYQCETLGAPPPAITTDLLKLMLDYAAAHRFGGK